MPRLTGWASNCASGCTRGLSLQGAHFYQDRRTGNLMALATNDIDAVEMAAGEAMLAGFDGSLTLVLVVAMMSLGVDARLAACALLPFPADGAARSGGSRATCTRRRAVRWNASPRSTITCRRRWPGVRTVRALGLQARSEAQFSALAGGAASASLDAQRWEAAYEPAVGFTLATATFLTLGVGGWLVWQRPVDGRPAHQLQPVPGPVDLADVRGRLGALAAWSAARRRGAGCSRCWTSH